MGHQSSLSNSPGSTRIQFEAARTAAGVGGGVLWLGFGRGVRLGGILVWVIVSRGKRL